MDNSLVVNNKVYLNDKLQQVTENIRTYDINIRNNQFAIAHLMSLVDAKEWYKDDGFENAAMWACDAFNIKKTLAYQLITIGREYIRPVINGKGKTIGYTSNIIPECEGIPPVDYTVSQLARLATLGHTMVKASHDTGAINPRMTVKEITDYIKSVKALNKPTEQATEKPTEQPTEQATEKPTEQPTEQATEQPTEQPTEQATEQPTEQPEKVYNIGKRYAMFDDISTDKLIAEIRARGFKVINQLNEEMIFVWSD